MASVGTVVIEVDANTAKLVQGVKESNKRLGNLQKSANNATKSLLKIGAGAISIYAVGRALQSVVTSSFNYNVAMENSEAKLYAMISASKDYVTVSGKQVSAMERQAMIASETSETMDLLKKVNSQTAMGMTDLIDTYALMKPAMDIANISTKDQVDILKLVTNTASNFGLSAQELSTGIDDLASGTWKTSQSFGKMMKAIGVTKEGMKDAGDKVAYLKEKMKETGETQDTWTVAVSNFGVAWDNLNGKLTEGIFEDMKKAVKELTTSFDKTAPSSMQVFADALVDMANAGVKTIGFLIKAFSQLVGLIQISYAGWMKLRGFINGGDVGELNAELKELQRIQKEGDYGLFSNSSYGTVRRNIKAKKEEIAETIRWNNIRKDGENMQERVAKRTDTINKMVNNGLKKVKFNYKTINDEVKKTTKTTDKLKDKTRETVTDTKALAKAQKEALALYRKYLELTGKKDEIFALDVEKTMAEFIKSGKYSAEQLSDIYDGMWKDYQEAGKKANKDIAMDFTNQFSGLLDGIFDGDIGGAIGGLFDGIGTELLSKPIKALSESMNEMLVGSDGVGGLLGGLGAMGGVVGGLAMSGIGMLVDSFFGDEEEEPPVLGEIRSLSDTLENSLDNLMDVQYPMLAITRDMRGYLETISLAFGGVENSLLRSGIDIGGSLFQDTYKKGTLFGGKSTSLYGTEIGIEARTMAELMNGELEAYLDTITKTVKTKWYGAKKTSYSHSYTDISDDIAGYMSDATTSIFESLTMAGEALGISTTVEEEVTKWVAGTADEVSGGLFGGLRSGFGSFFGSISKKSGFGGLFGIFGKKVATETGEWVTETVSSSLANEIIDIGKFDTTGMSADEVASEIQGRFSAQVDAITEKYFGVVAEFQKAGEGLGETLFRVIRNFDQVSHSMDLIGKSVDWRTANIITDVAGGLDSLNASMSSYQQNFFSEAEQYEMMLHTMTKSFASLGLTVPKSNAEFRNLVDGIDTTTDAGATLFAEVISLADGFAEMTDSASTLGEAVSQITDAWLGNLSYLTLKQKAEYASGYFDISKKSGGAIDTVESARLMAETALKSTSTKEDYIPIFERYVTELENKAPEATADDIVAEIRALRGDVQGLEETTRRTSA